MADRLAGDRRRSAEWMARIPKQDYGAICDTIVASAATKH